jgi:N-acetyl sugar amidotransferase
VYLAKKNQLKMMEQKYQVCSKCVMDTTDKEIEFDANGVCNHCRDFEIKYRELPKQDFTDSSFFSETIASIKASSKNDKYDCILGLSGGVDSSYMVYLCKEAGIKPLIVHFDNGWNSEFAISNIQNLVSKLGFELYTYVINWEEFKDLQLSYFKASVLDLEVPTDHLIFGALYAVAKKHKIHSIISGYNLTSEGIMPRSWLYEHKFDRANMKDIHKTYGSGSMRNLPTIGLWQRIYFTKIYKFKQYHLLQSFNYNKIEAKKFLIEKFDWKDYGGKHYESVFTRFYQGYILPQKFNIDKRKAHLSTLINSGQMLRSDAVEELKLPTYEKKMQQDDLEYVCKKWNISIEEFDRIMNLSENKHSSFKEEINLERKVNRIIKFIKPFIPKRFKNA